MGSWYPCPGCGATGGGPGGDIPTVQTGCCPDPVPTILCVNITGGAGPCGTAMSFPLFYSGPPAYQFDPCGARWMNYAGVPSTVGCFDFYENLGGQGSPCFGYFWLECAATWRLVVSSSRYCTLTNITLQSVECSPFKLIFAATQAPQGAAADCPGAGAPVTITITDVTQCGGWDRLVGPVWCPTSRWPTTLSVTLTQRSGGVCGLGGGTFPLTFHPCTYADTDPVSGIPIGCVIYYGGVTTGPGPWALNLIWYPGSALGPVLPHPVFTARGSGANPCDSGGGVELRVDSCGPAIQMTNVPGARLNIRNANGCPCPSSYDVVIHN